jgi:bla regulator protein blaR1
MYFALQLTIYWLLSYSFYAIFLRHLTFFTLNRFWILANLILGLIWPLVSQDQAVVSTMPEAWLPVFEVSSQLVIAAQKQTTFYFGSFEPMLKLAYGLVSLILLFRLISGIYHVTRLQLKTTDVSTFQGVKLMISDRITEPFSFLNRIYMPKNHAFSNLEYQQILVHEACHLKERHSLDILFCECMKVLFWWNPIIYLWKQALVDQHEYIADQAVLQSYTPLEYGQFLLLQVHVRTQLAPVHTIFQSPIKKRILMMTSQVSTTSQVVRYFLFLPLVFCTHYFTLHAQSTLKTNSVSRHKPVVLTDTIIAIDPVTYKESVKVVENSYYESADVPPVYGTCDQSSSSDELQTCSAKNLMQFLIENMKYPEAAKKSGVTGKVFVSFFIDATGAPRSPMILRSLGADCDAEVLRVVALMDKWSPALVSGKPVPFKYTIPVSFQL